MKRNFWIALSIVIFLSLSLMGYGLYINYVGENIIAERMADRALLINADVVKERDIKSEYTISEAKLEAYNAVDVIARTNGIIKQSMLYKNKMVNAGETIVTLENEMLPLNIKSANSSVKRAKAEEIRARNTYERYLNLLEHDATSLEKMDEVRSMYEAAVANMEDAQARYEQALMEESRLEITAPISGSVVVIYKQQGSVVSAGTPICMVADFSQLWFSVNMNEEDLQAILGNEGMASTFTLYHNLIGSDKAYNTDYAANDIDDKGQFYVYIHGIFPGLEETASMRRVVFSLDNSHAVLEPHSYKYLTLQSNTPRNVLSVNIKALFDKDSENNQRNVFVVTAENKLEKRVVKIGAVNKEYAEVLSGLKEGEIVVTSGVDGLSEGEKVRINGMEEDN